MLPRRPGLGRLSLVSPVVGAIAAAVVVSGIFAAPVTATAREIAPRDSLVTSLDTTPLAPHDIVIDATGSYAFVVTCTSGQTAQIIRIDLSTFTMDDSAALTSTCGRAVAMQDDTIYVTTSDRLYRIGAATFGPSGPTTSDSVAIDDYGNALDVYGSYAYIGHHVGASGDKITKVNITGPTMTVATTFPSGGSWPWNMEIDPTGTYAYVVHPTSNTLTKIRLSDDSVVASLPVGQSYGVALDDSGTYAYVPSAYSPYLLMRVRLSDFTVDDSVVLPVTWAYGVDVNAAGTLAYVGRDRQGTDVVKVNLGPSMSVEETISVPSAPSTLAISPTAPYVYTANSADLQGRTVSKIAIIGSTPAPTVSGLSSTSGPLSGGGTVTISGDNLTGATGVSFGGTAATILSGSDDTVAVTVPAAGSAGARNVTVTTPGGTSTQSAPYTYLAAPVVTSMLPSSGPTSGGTVVTITGTDLSGATVDIGGTQAATTANTGTSLAFTTPAAPAGPASVTLTTPGGSAGAGTFTYQAPPAPIPPAAPMAPIAAPGSSSARVSWSPVETPGSFPVSTFQVTSSPTGGSCLTTALSCEIAGLSNGTSYTFRVRALSGAGWGGWSPPSAAVTPAATAAPSIVISGSRDQVVGRSVITVSGISTLPPGTILRPWLKRPAGSRFTEGSAAIAAASDGSFTWSRRAARAITVYVQTLDGSVRSNSIRIR
jgi:DNA-binding beta-propeller fold protein YncE